MDDESMSGNRRVEIISNVAADSAQRRIILNVGGQKHETYLGTIKNFPDSRLYWVVENVSKAIDYNSDRIELFFDRHPGIFTQVLNYYRTGKLHCPNDVCGPLFEEELAYWGIDEKDMEPCCWTSYTQHREAEENLKSFNPPPECDSEPENEVGEELSNSRQRRKLSWHSQWQHLQARVWAILDEPRSSKAAKVFSIVSILLIVLSVAASCAQTLPRFRDYRSNYNLSASSVSNTDKTSKTLFDLIEYFCGVWFTLELFLRIIFCPHRLNFFKRFTNWIDILSVLPFYLRFVNQKVADAFLIIRLLRLYRFFRLLYGLQVLMHTLKASSYELGLLLLILLIPVVLFSSMIFYVENNLDDNTKFSSIPKSFWWSLITMTTVGYGDMAPKTWAGQIIGGACAICGVLMVALPISIIGSNFNLYYAHAQARLKLPRKKNRIHFDALATALSSRHTFRRRALRRRSPGSCVGDSLKNSSSAKTHRNSAVKRRESNETISWSASTSLSESFGGTRHSPNTSRRKLSKEKQERKFSRREKVQYLEHLMEKDELSDVCVSENNKCESGRKSLGLPQVSDCLPSWLAQSYRARRSRSSSVPSNSQCTPFKLKIPLKSKSESSNLCKKCSLPKEGSTNSEFFCQMEDSSTEADFCKCRSTKKKRNRKESEISRTSQVSNFTLLIHDGLDERQDEFMLVSADSVDATTKSQLHGCPVQVQVMSSNQLGIETPLIFDVENKGDLSDSSENSLGPNCSDSAPEHGFNSMGEQERSRTVNEDTNIARMLAGATEKLTRRNTDSPKLPKLVIEMPILAKRTSEHETSI